MAGAHSVEAWSDGELAGGVYGWRSRPVRRRVDVHGIRDGSKAALVQLVQRLRERGFQLFDVQYLNDHTARLGAVEVRRREYLARLRFALACKVEFV